METAAMNIGDAANASGVSAKMIRHYEQIGLMPAARRSSNGYRVYGDSDIHTLTFIRRARRMGFSIEQIRDLLALWQDQSRSSGDVKHIVLEHLSNLDQRIAELTAMRRTLQHLAAHCHGDARPDCPILDDLAG